MCRDSLQLTLDLIVSSSSSSTGDCSELPMAAWCTHSWNTRTRLGRNSWITIQYPLLQTFRRLISKEAPSHACSHSFGQTLGQCLEVDSHCFRELQLYHVANISIRGENNSRYSRCMIHMSFLQTMFHMTYTACKTKSQEDVPLRLCRHILVTRLMSAGGADRTGAPMSQASFWPDG